MLNDHRETIGRLIQAGERAVEELIKILRSEIITDDPDKDVAADRLKNAAATKKMALMDAFDMLSRIEQEKAKLNGDTKEEEPKFQSFAEKRGRKS